MPCPIHTHNQYLIGRSNKNNKCSTTITKRVRLDSVISGSVMLTVVQCITYRNLDYQTFNNVQNNLEQCIKRYTFGEKLKL